MEDKHMPISDQINILFLVMRAPNGKLYKATEVCETIGITPATMSQLRNGTHNNPNLATLRKICAFFNVPLAYFDCQSQHECLAYLDRHFKQDANGNIHGITDMLKVYHGLSDEGVNFVLEAINYVKTTEQVNDSPEAEMPVVQ